MDALAEETLAACTCTMEVGIFACILLLIAAREDDVIELRPAALPLCVLTTILEALPAGTDWCPLSTIPAAVVFNKVDAGLVPVAAWSTAVF